MPKLPYWTFPVAGWLVVSLALGLLQLWAGYVHQVAFGLAGLYGFAIWIWVTFRVARYLDSHLWAGKVVGRAKARSRWK